MPTVPPTCAPVDGDTLPGPLSDPDLLTLYHSAGPTPDPDTDDVVLVPVDDGNAISQESPDQAPPLSSVKPRIELGAIILHSPSSIVGTPFDLSPRFEYPFSNPPCSSTLIQDFNPFAPLSTVFSPSLHSYPPTLSLPVAVSLPLPRIQPVVAPRARGEGRNFSPTHPKLYPRDPPIPPGLVKRRRLNYTAARDAVASAADSPQDRAWGGSISSLSDSEKIECQILGWEHEKDGAQSQSSDFLRRRNSLALCETTAEDGKIRSLLSLSLYSEPTRPVQEYRPPSAPPRSPS